MYFVLVLLLSRITQGCDKKHRVRHHNRHIYRRDTAPSFPPILTPQEQILVSSFDDTSMASWSSYYSHKRNLAGESSTVPEWTAAKWAEYGFDTRLDSYHVYLNYPVHQSLTLRYPNGSTYNLTLEEPMLEEDPTTSSPNRIPAFHGYSASGNVSAPYIYIGRATTQDLQHLSNLNISLAGKIGLAKHGGPFRGTKLRNAHSFNLAGLLLFTDPADDTEMATPAYAPYPAGPARNPWSVQRGSVLDLTKYPGDPTTPGYASKEGVERKGVESLPEIPSLPLSWGVARGLLEGLEGWAGEGDYSGRSDAVLEMRNEMKGGIEWIYNAVGVVNGTEGDEVVVVGNHHDAWMVGGAADPHSGSAILIELARAIGKLLETGWRPKRTIVLCSWDAEEYGLVGSTEWVEEYTPWLKSSAVSYLNIDVGVSGTIPDFSASPDLHSLVTSTAQKVIWPHGENRTIYDVWEERAGEIDLLGAQSDYTAFVHRGGISAMDIGTTRAPLDPIYHTHSNFDSYYWMTRFADPGFVMHKAIGQFLTLMLFHLVNDDVVPLEPSNYGMEMQAWLADLHKLISSTNGTAAVRVEQLEDAITAFEEAARLFNAARDAAVVSNNVRLIMELNRKARDFGREFINQGGLPGRPFYQHLLFAPGIDTGYRPVTFPGITEAVSMGNFTLANEYLGRTVKAVLGAASILTT
ncbi:hypothetical protein COCC4DRAFT_56324 [Bipolaris maydis ATCC 48331]|uniref:Peptidase M28 domain-containing protein n=2 Tax=Cochliobolus heterostrophus TaxID=5016 RepID=M2UP37_COCH5|nr:uncharacterized protein COCC4DRAFT_56324 [Bipolaris maydis ATCC 48331]EMD89702.1 hypothetical protein COCHEDRAFT_1195041 [Bipolaris maydis C5]ENI10085.1 hypothetical protein COCC4DRAFT_56324 [Bipolaris maydis ATCC 48331]KAJ5064193.1 hypothetical protein J3E74DRAFT_462748 [Bipolaris maydis]KAJ6207546.1 hypothetical protein PSV09DRAFT_1195041 [Bipolaris maydis]